MSVCSAKLPPSLPVPLRATAQRPLLCAVSAVPLEWPCTFTCVPYNGSACTTQPLRYTGMSVPSLLYRSGFEPMRISV